MHRILQPLRKQVVFIFFLDDIFIAGKSWTELRPKLVAVLTALREAGLTMNIRKCQFLKSSVTYLGLEVSANGIKPGQGKVEAIKRFPVPKNVHEIRRFLGLTGFFRRFVPRYAEIAAPLSGLLKSDREFIWSREVSDAFTALRDKLVERPILQPFNSKKRTELHTDASSRGLAAMLLQEGSDSKMHLKMLLLVMIRALKPFVLTAGPTMELNLETCSTDNIETSHIEKLTLSTLFEIAGPRTRDDIIHTSAASLGQRATLSRRPVFVLCVCCKEPRTRISRRHGFEREDRRARKKLAARKRPVLQQQQCIVLYIYSDWQLLLYSKVGCSRRLELSKQCRRLHTRSKQFDGAIEKAFVIFVYQTVEDKSYFLKHALHERAQEMVELLVDSELDIHEARFEDGKSAVHYLAEVLYWINDTSCDPKGKALKLMEYFLENPEGNYPDQHGYTYLHGACMSGDVSAVNALLSQGVDVNLDTYTCSPLHIAVQYRHLRVVERLLMNGANPNQPDHEQSTPLHALTRLCICQCTNGVQFCDERKPVDKIVQRLIEHGANIEAQNRHGDRPLDLAVSRFDVQLVESLLRHGASLGNLNEDKMFSANLTSIELKNYPFTLNIIQMIQFLQSVGYEVSLQTRLRMIKCWLRIRGDDTHHLRPALNEAPSAADKYIRIVTCVLRASGSCTTPRAHYISRAHTCTVHTEPRCVQKILQGFLRTIRVCLCAIYINPLPPSSRAPIDARACLYTTCDRRRLHTRKDNVVGATRMKCNFVHDIESIGKSRSRSTTMRRRKQNRAKWKITRGGRIMSNTSLSAHNLLHRNVRYVRIIQTTEKYSSIRVSIQSRIHKSCSPSLFAVTLNGPRSRRFRRTTMTTTTTTTTTVHANSPRTT
ncbi:unnamed protein product [Trichogramma brassicae]|uniref:Reverse transcriptase domain-containing protein n=1 Tax=Trichogramma brassicae TaxID=86971 RepID=A0A6H5ILB3_9HYME|nr:unnamed protein product [Trichogramma brassicae]